MKEEYTEFGNIIVGSFFTTPGAMLYNEIKPVSLKIQNNSYCFLQYGVNQNTNRLFNCILLPMLLASENFQ